MKMIQRIEVGDEVEMPTMEEVRDKHQEPEDRHIEVVDGSKGEVQAGGRR